MSTNADVVIVGAGVAGLAAAFALRGAGRRVVVVDRATRVGGLVESERIGDDVLLEHGADAVLSQKRGGKEMLEALGLGPELVRAGRAPKRAFVWSEAGLLPMPGGLFSFERRALLTMLSSPLLSVRGKLRLALEPLMPRADEEDEPVSTFFARRLGPEVAARLCAPMVRGVYGAEPSEIGVRSIFPTLAGYEDRFGSVGLALVIAPRSPRGGGLVTPRGGMDRIPERLASQSGAQLALGVGVRSIERRGRGARVTLDDGACLEAGAVVVATDVATAARLLAPLSPQLGDLLGDIRATDVEVVTLGVARHAVAHPLDGTGFVVGRDGTQTLACTFASEKWHGRAPEGTAVFRSVLRGAREASEEALVETARSELAEILGVVGKPLWARVRRRPRALPVYGVGHAARIARVRGIAHELGGIALAGNYLGGVGVPDAISSGTDAATALGLSPAIARDAVLEHP